MAGQQAALKKPDGADIILRHRGRAIIIHFDHLEENEWVERGSDEGAEPEAATKPVVINFKFNYVCNWNR